ncbi:hypothetical protein CU098_013194 [Rhizopus stolonifer]|uniref:Uncharacterized protein n=1 Tax=Rhizopus stolonifer TaxID=4846 RepID=A0A367KSE2_RHIST|nr:hypothetical protein CU098_013194 [Rhizopus stolonifer]
MKASRLSFASRFADLIASEKFMKKAGNIVEVCEQLAEGKIIQLVQCDDGEVEEDEENEEGEESNKGEFDKDDKEFIE